MNRIFFCRELHLCSVLWPSMLSNVLNDVVPILRRCQIRDIVDNLVQNTLAQISQRAILDQTLHHATSRRTATRRLNLTSQDQLEQYSKDRCARCHRAAPGGRRSDQREETRYTFAQRDSRWHRERNSKRPLPVLDTTRRPHACSCVPSAAEQRDNRKPKKREFHAELRRRVTSKERRRILPLTERAMASLLS